MQMLGRRSGIIRRFGSGRSGAAAILLLVLSALACAGTPSPDPLFSDGPIDPANPARLWEGAFTSGGGRLNAIALEAAGAGPHPTVILLHGFPGNERNLDLAQALRRVGFNVVFFHYRGAWGSGGAFSFENVLEDVHAVVASVREPAWAAEHRVDVAAISIVGHSMGGFASLVAGSENDAVGCIAALAAANVGASGQASDPAALAAVSQVLDTWLEGRLVGTSGAALIAEISQQPERFDVMSHLDGLARKRVLLVSGSRDEVVPLAALHEPLAAGLRSRNAVVETRILDADHSFSSRRIGLARAVAGFLGEHCVSRR